MKLQLVQKEFCYQYLAAFIGKLFVAELFNKSRAVRNKAKRMNVVYKSDLLPSAARSSKPHKQKQP